MWSLFRAKNPPFSVILFLVHSAIIHGQLVNLITRPTVGDVLVAGTSFDILWNVTTPGELVSLILRKGPSNNIGVVGVIADSIQNTGEFVWNIPNNLVSGTDYAIEIIVGPASNVANVGPDGYNYTPLLPLVNNSTEPSSSITSTTTSSAPTTSSSSTGLQGTTSTSSTKTTISGASITSNASSGGVSTTGSQQTSGIPAPPVSSGSTPSPQESKNIPLGAVVGGVIGGVLFGAALVLLLYWIRKRAKKSRNVDRVATEQSSELSNHGTKPAAQNVSSAAEVMGYTGEKLAPDIQEDGGNRQL